MKTLINERGAALITALMMLTILMLLGFASLILSNIDIKIAGNERSSMASQYAAEAGLAAAVRFMNSTSGQLALTSTAGIPASPGAYGYQPSNPNWSQNLSGSIAGTGYNYTATVSFLPNPGNIPADPVVNYPVCAFDQTFQYPNSPPNDGYPVLVIDSTATGPNNSNCKIEEQVTKYVIPIQNAIRGAVTSNGTVNVTGNITISGNTYDENGVPVTGSPLPGVDSQLGGSTGGSSTVNGSTGTITTTIPTDSNTNNMINSLAQAFGLSDAGVYFDSKLGYVTPELYAILSTAKIYTGSQAPSSTDLASGGIFYVQAPYASSNLTGNGLLLVHNPYFDPQAWRVSNPYEEDGVTPNPYYSTSATGYDPRLDSKSALYNSAYHAQCAPFNLGNLNGGTFKGVIIADEINKINGNVNIYGAVMSLSSLVVANQIGAGTANILYSPDAISKYVTDNASINKRLSWEKKTAY